MVQRTGIAQVVSHSTVDALGPFFTPGVRVIDEEVLAAPGTFTFTDLDQHYRDLALFCQLRSNYAAEYDEVELNFNNDAAANYDWVYKQATGAGAFWATGLTPANSIEIALVEAANSRADVFTMCVIWIQSYRFTDPEKIAYCSSGVFGDRSALGDFYIKDNRGAWRSQAAITRIDLAPNNGTNFTAGSRVTVRGYL